MLDNQFTHDVLDLPLRHGLEQDGQKDQRCSVSFRWVMTVSAGSASVEAEVFFVRGAFAIDRWPVDVVSRPSDQQPSGACPGSMQH